MAPFMLLFLTEHENIDFIRLLNVSFGRKDILEDLKRFAIAGISALKRA